MTAVEAYEDACRTVRYWRNRGVTAVMVAGQLRCRAEWRVIIEHIVFELLVEADGGQLPLPLRLAA